jgi:hypothetical protein
MEMLLIADMQRPLLQLDAILWHVASWGDRRPHAICVSPGRNIVNLSVSDTRGAGSRREW